MDFRQTALHRRHLMCSDGRRLVQRIKALPQSSLCSQRDQLHQRLDYVFDSYTLAMTDL
jgi:hypothetical protein